MRYIPIIPMSVLYLYTYQLENYWLSDEIIQYIPIIPMSALYLYTYQLENYFLSDEIIRYIPIITALFHMTNNNSLAGKYISTKLT
jgi:hypothetical protein